MRLAWSVLALGLFGSTAVMADGLECQANIIYGDNQTVLDVATGSRVVIVPEPYLPSTDVFGSYEFSLGGGDFTPVPASSRYEPAPYTPPALPYEPAAPYTPPAMPYTPEPPVMPEPPMPGATPSDFLNGTMWRLQSLGGQAATAPATLNFGADGGFGGRAACNTYGGGFAAFTNFMITMENTFSTRAACPQLQEEQAMFAAFSAATDFRPGREGDTLALLGEGGVTLATFVRDGDVPGQTGASIVGNWNVAGVLVDGVLSTDSGFGTPRFEFTEGGRFSANLGCNTATGDYTQSGDMLTFGTFAVSAVQCFVPAPFEGPIQMHLPNIRMIQAIGGGISLRDSSGIELIRLTR